MLFRLSFAKDNVIHRQTAGRSRRDGAAIEASKRPEVGGLSLASERLPMKLNRNFLLAAILPAPLKRRPARMNQYSALILERMRQMGW